jgi:hypothetical protein
MILRRWYCFPGQRCIWSIRNGMIMKRNIVLLCLMLFLVQGSEAQIVEGVMTVYRQAKKAVQAAMLTEAVESTRGTIKTTKKLSKHLEDFKKSIQLDEDTKESMIGLKNEIEELNRLKKEFMGMYESLKEVEKLTARDYVFWGDVMLGMDMDPVSYIPDTKGSRKLKSDLYNLKSGTISSRNLYYKLKSTKRGMESFSEVEDDGVKGGDEGEGYSESEINEVLLDVEESIGILMMERYRLYTKKISYCNEQAEEITKVMLDQGSMLSVYDRVELQILRNQLLEEAAVAREKANTLIKDITAYKDQEATKELLQEADDYNIKIKIAGAYAKAF